MELALQNKTEAAQLTQMIIRVGLDALSKRLLTTIALLGDCVLFGWAMAYPDAVRLTAAVLFAIATWCLVNVRMEQKPREEEK